MSQKAINIYTPASADPHIYAEDEAQINRARFGGSGISTADNRLACTILDSNTVQLDSGMFSNQGFLICIPGGQTETFSIVSATAGAYRKDLLVAHFIRGGGDVADSHVFEVMQGVEAGSLGAAEDPAPPGDDLAAGESERAEPLYRITVYGSTIVSVERLAVYIGNIYQ